MSSQEHFDTNSRITYSKRKKYQNDQTSIKTEDRNFSRYEKVKKGNTKCKIIRFIVLLVLLLINAAIIFFLLYLTFNKYIHELKCKSGYFRPDDEKENQKCKQCTVNNCETCIGNKTLDYCIKCQSEYEPVYLNNIIKFCTDYNNIECLKYNINTNECESCNDGYYLAFYSETKKKCRKCLINNCKKCFGSTLSHICNECQNGYFIPQDDETKQNCVKCSVENCEKCIGIKTFNMCLHCLPGYKSKTKNNMITSCEL